MYRSSRRGGEHGDEDLPELTGKWSLKAALLVYLARVVDRCFFFFGYSSQAPPKTT